MTESKTNKKNKTTYNTSDFLTSMNPVSEYNTVFFDQSHFHHILQVEYMRTERSKKPFLLLLLDITRLVDTAKNTNVIDKVRTSLNPLLREIDIRGWYDHHKVIGVIFTEIEYIDEASIDSLINKIFNRFREKLKPDWIEEIDITYFTPLYIMNQQLKMLKDIIIKPGVGKTPRIIMVASTVAGVGKSLIAVNLARIMIMELNSQVLLVDYDLENPSLTRWFGLQKRKGLADYLSGKATINDLLIKTSIDKLSILSGGNNQGNLKELADSNKMINLIQDLKSRYDDRYIVIDFPPVLATTQPNVLHEILDGIILVVKSVDNPQEVIHNAFLSSNKDKILGIVPNDMKLLKKSIVPNINL